MVSEFVLYEIAKLHYIDKMKQKEIADMYNINPMYVSRLLKKAEENNIVTITIKNPYELNLDLGLAIKNKYKLIECVVLKEIGNSNTSVEEYAANYLLGLMHNGAILGTSWGNTISEICRRLPETNLSESKVFQITGGFNSSNATSMSPSEVVNLIAGKFKCNSLTLNAPLYVNSQDVKKQLINNPINSKVFEMANKSWINLIGASDLTKSSTSMKVGLISEEDYRELVSMKSVGDIAGYFLDSEGNPLKWSKSDLVMSIPLETIASATHVICAAHGKNKSKILKAALQQKYLNILITTEDIAMKLL